MASPTKESLYRSMKRLFKNYIRMCARRNVFWNISVEQFHEITSKSCFYCDRPPEQISRSYKYNGLDRVDHKKGYELANIVACCKSCNWIKGDRLTSEETLVVAQALKSFREKKKG